MMDHATTAPIQSQRCLRTTLPSTRATIAARIVTGNRPQLRLSNLSRGFADTDRVRLLIEPSARVDGAAGSAYAEISTIVVATTRAGNERVFAGCYTMRRSNVQDRGWLIYRANISQVPSSARISRMLSQVCN